MSDINSVTIIGRLTEKPVIRYTQSGTPVTTLKIVNNSFVRTLNGETKEKANFFNVTVWGKQAENCSQYLDKGRQVAIMGRLDYRTWQTQTGEKRNSVEIIARSVQFLGPSKSQQISSESSEVEETPYEESSDMNTSEEVIPEDTEPSSEDEDFNSPLDDETIPF